MSYAADRKVQSLPRGVWLHACCSRSLEHLKRQVPLTQINDFCRTPRSLNHFDWAGKTAAFGSWRLETHWRNNSHTAPGIDVAALVDTEQHQAVATALPQSDGKLITGENVYVDG